MKQYKAVSAYPQNVYQIWNFILTYPNSKAIVVENVLIGEVYSILKMQTTEIRAIRTCSKNVVILKLYIKIIIHEPTSYKMLLQP